MNGKDIKSDIIIHVAIIISIVLHGCVFATFLVVLYLLHQLALFLHMENTFYVYILDKYAHPIVFISFVFYMTSDLIHKFMRPSLSQKYEIIIETEAEQE